MSKRDISAKDKYRVILTDTLPYETPIIFSNEGLYEYLLSGKTHDIMARILSDNNSGSRPYNYTIKKGVDSVRTLSVPHPVAQVNFSHLYEKYDSLIIDLCSRSEFSLRFPSKVASAFYEKRQLTHDLSGEKAVEEEREIESTQQQFASSYFVYSKYNFIHKFYDSYEFHRLEKRYHKHFKFDISKCFPSIYTHTIAWAVKNKRYAKKNKGAASFEKKFDRYMQDANDLETHGIVVGPEFSRIFAEIILQRIDNDAKDALFDLEWIHQKDYTVRRYIDDYFVFYNNERCLKDIKAVFRERLEDYKLFINDEKCFDYERPFITPISVAKMEVFDFLKWFGGSTFPENLVQDNGESLASSIRQPHLYSNKCIARFKAILNKHGIQYDSVSRLTLATLNKKLAKFIRQQVKYIRDVHAGEIQKCDSERIKRRLWIWLDFTFFMYSMDVTPRTTHILSRSLFYVNSFLELLRGVDSEDLIKKVLDDSSSVISMRSQIGKKVSVESCNLLITMAALGEPYGISSEYILRGFNLDSESDSLGHLDYFSIMSLLFCIGSNSGFDQLRPRIGDEILSRIQCVDDMLSDSESVLLFLDAVGCGFLPEDKRKEIVKAGLATYLERVTQRQIDSAYAFISQRKWFMDWKSAVHFDEILSKKELRTPY